MRSHTASLLFLLALASAPAAFADSARKPIVPADVAQQLRESLAPRESAFAEGLRRHLDRTSALTDARSTQPLGAADADRIESGSFGQRRRELGQLREEFRREFAALKEGSRRHLSARAGAEVDAVKARIEARFDEMSAAYAAVENARTPGQKRQALSTLRARLKSAYLSERDRDAAPSTAPTPSLSHLAPAGEPSDANRSERLPVYLSAAPLRGWELAFNGDPIVLSAAPPVAPQTSNCSVAPADTEADGREIVFTDEVKALAEQLGYSPARIYQWVYDQVRFESYWGSLKGAKGALLARSGNATDQASLLIALLRYSGVPARYVRGTVAVLDQVPQDNVNGRVQRWLGVKNYNAAAQLLAGGGIPAGIYTLNSVAQGAVFDHVWVEACVPYSSYRGAAVDDGGYRWVPLDTSYKDQSYQLGLAVSVDIDATLAQYRAEARTHQLPNERYRERVHAAVALVNPTLSAEDVPYRSRQLANRVDVLPATLPFSVVDFDNWPGSSLPDTAALPDAHRYKFTAIVKSGTTGTGTTLLTTTASYPEAALSKVSLSYTPDTASQALWNSWGGDLTALPAGAVNVLARLKLDGVVQGSASNTLPLGQAHTVIMKLTLAERSGGTCIADGGSGTDPDGTCVNKTLYTDQGGRLLRARSLCLSGGRRAACEPGRAAVRSGAHQPDAADAGTGERLRGDGGRAAAPGAARLHGLDGASG